MFCVIEKIMDILDVSINTIMYIIFAPATCVRVICESYFTGGMVHGRKLSYSPVPPLGQLSSKIWNGGLSPVFLRSTTYDIRCTKIGVCPQLKYERRKRQL
jgi:hypothetical protein